MAALGFTARNPRPAARRCYPPNVRCSILLVIVSLLGVGEPALAVDLTGVVRLRGPLPTARSKPVDRDGRVCGATVPDDGLQVDAQGRIQGAIVFVENAPPAKESHEPQK